MGQFIYNTKGFTDTQSRTFIYLLSHKHHKENNFARGDYFEYGGRIFDGNYDATVQCFVRNNPDGGDFLVWLCQHVRQFKRESL